MRFPEFPGRSEFLLIVNAVKHHIAVKTVFREQLRKISEVDYTLSCAAELDFIRFFYIFAMREYDGAPNKFKRILQHGANIFAPRRPPPEKDSRDRESSQAASSRPRRAACAPRSGELTVFDASVSTASVIPLLSASSHSRSVVSAMSRHAALGHIVGVSGP